MTLFVKKDQLGFNVNRKQENEVKNLLVETTSTLSIPLLPNFG